MNNQPISFITGIWDLNRDQSKPGWQRSFDHYLNNFIRLLCDMKDFNLIIFIDPSLEDLVWQHRSKSNCFSRTCGNFASNPSLAKSGRSSFRAI